MSLIKGDVLIVVAARAPGGKTARVREIVESMRTQGFTPVAMKPVETSCPSEKDHDIGSRDGLALHRLMNGRVPLPVVSPYRFRGVGSAQVAARAAGIELRLDDLVAAMHEASRYGDILVVEASGPALSPLAEDGDAFDLAQRVSAKVIAAVGDEPGGAEALLPLLERARSLDLEIIPGGAV